MNKYLGVKQWGAIGAIVISALTAGGCTAAQLAECMSYGLSYATCVSLGNGGGGGGGSAPPDNDNPGVQ